MPRIDQISLKVGERGGSLLEDFILREKITHVDHERIPERVVHARGAAAHRESTRKGRKPSGPEGAVIGRDADMSGAAGEFMQAVAQHGAWGRERQG